MGICSKICVQEKRIKNLKYKVMNPSADEETLSAAEVSKTNQVTVGTVTTTSTTNTQTVAGTGACYIPLFTGHAPQQALSKYSYQSSGYQQSVADYQEHPMNFLRSTYLAPPTRVQEAYNVYCMMTMQTTFPEEPMKRVDL